MALDLALVNADDEVVSEMWSEVSYYSGYEGGESWSEGSREDERYFRAPPAGEYRMILKGTGGSGLRGPPRDERVSVELRAGPVVTRYFIAIFVVALLVALLGLAQRIMFEVRRWAPVMESDED